VRAGVPLLPGQATPLNATEPIVASVLTDKDADDGSQVAPLLERIDGAVASVTGDGAYDRDDVYAEVAARHPAAAVVVPPRANAVPSEAAETAPTQRDAHLRCIEGKCAVPVTRIGRPLPRYNKPSNERLDLCCRVSIC
jgi:hypothetical protein